MQQPRKTFDPRSNRVINPFVQAYVERQEERGKPLSERQKLINLVLVFGVALNLVVLGLVALSMRSAPAAAAVRPLADDTVTMAEAMEKIRALDATVQTMRSNVEFHRNAYFKLEQEHETLRSVLAQVVPPGSEKEVTSIYNQKSFAAQTLPNPQLESPEALEALKQAQVQQAEATQQAIALKGQTASGQ